MVAGQTSSEDMGSLLTPSVMALHPSGVDESSTSFGWGKCGNVSSAGWQVTLCDPVWQVSCRSRTGVAG